MNSVIVFDNVDFEFVVRIEGKDGGWNMVGWLGC